MFPYRDENPTELTPFVTVGLIAANVAVWVFVQGMGTDLGAFQNSVCSFGLIPAEVTGQAASFPARYPSELRCPLGGLRWFAAITSMFMHGGWFHLLANMMFLWVFGNNVEDSMGHVRFVAFYLLAGLGGAAAHVFLNPDSGVPTVGASGAISGALGAYLVLYPRVTVYVLFPPFWVLRLPAYLVLGYWIALQLLMGVADLGGGFGTGVAVWAHIGGFAVGLLTVRLFEREPLVQAKREGRRLDRREIRDQHWWW